MDATHILVVGRSHTFLGAAFRGPLAATNVPPSPTMSEIPPTSSTSSRGSASASSHLALLDRPLLDRLNVVGLNTVPHFVGPPSRPERMSSSVGASRASSRATSLVPRYSATARPHRARVQTTPRIRRFTPQPYAARRYAADSSHAVHRRTPSSRIGAYKPPHCGQCRRSSSWSATSPSGAETGETAKLPLSCKGFCDTPSETCFVSASISCFGRFSSCFGCFGCFPYFRG